MATMLSLVAPVGSLNAARLSNVGCAGGPHAWSFEASGPAAGRTGRLLVIDVGGPDVVEELIPGPVVETFVGGRGIALWFLWRAVSEKTTWSDPANALVISPGPLCGATQFTGAGKSSIV